MDTACPSCGAKLETPLACTACGVLVQADDSLGPFAILGLEPAAKVDPAQVRKRVRRFTRLVHPDFFATAGEDQRLLAERNNAILNDARAVINDELRRTDWLIRRLGGPTEKELGAMPQAFLMEVMEWNEVLEDAEPGSPELESLSEELRDQRSQLLDSIHTDLTPLPEAGSPTLSDVRQALNALRYVDRALARAAGQAGEL